MNTVAAAVAVERRLHLLRRLAWLCAAVVLAVTSLSAFIRQSRAGLGCADWPACYGQALRSAQQGEAAPGEASQAEALARLAHRIAASAALLLVIVMLLVCADRPRLRREGALVLALLALAVFLAVLGAWSGRARASASAVAVGNLLGGLLMLALCVRLAQPARPPLGAPARAAVALAALLLVLQIALGAQVSASFAGLACDAGTCGLHRYAGAALALLLLALAAVSWRQGRRGGAALLAVLAPAQLAAGAALSTLGLPLPVALLHNLLAGALLATLAALD